MRILLLEDEKQIADFVINALRAKGYAVDHTIYGKEAAYLAKVNDYDLAILDFMLPDTDGLEVCKEIRQVKKAVPILMFSVIDDVKKKVATFEGGADDYLTKPFAVEELLVRVQALLRRGHMVHDDVITCRHITIDTKRQLVTSHGKPLDLRLKEYALLEYMMRNQGTVLSRAMLLEHVWDMNIDPFTNTIDVHIRALRKKLGDDDAKFIRTVHGAGYKLSE